MHQAIILSFSSMTSPSGSCLLLEGCLAATSFEIPLLTASAGIFHRALQAGAGTLPPARTVACKSYQEQRRPDFITRVTRTTSCEGAPSYFWNTGWTKKNVVQVMDSSWHANIRNLHASQLHMGQQGGRDVREWGGLFPLTPCPTPVCQIHE